MRRRKDSGDACALAPARGTVRAAGRGGGRGGTTGTQGAGCAFDSAQPQRRDADRGRESYQSVSVTAAGGLRVDYTSVSGVYIHTHLALRERDHHDVWDVQPEHPNSGLARGPQRVSMRGGDGVPWPAAGADFSVFLFCPIVYNRYLFSWEFGVLAGPCYHALRQPVGAADRAMLHN